MKFKENSYSATYVVGSAVDESSAASFLDQVDFIREEYPVGATWFEFSQIIFCRLLAACIIVRTDGESSASHEIHRSDDAAN